MIAVTHVWSLCEKKAKHAEWTHNSTSITAQWMQHCLPHGMAVRLSDLIQLKKTSIVSWDRSLCVDFIHWYDITNALKHASWITYFTKRACSISKSFCNSQSKWDLEQILTEVQQIIQNQTSRVHKPKWTNFPFISIKCYMFTGSTEIIIK